MKRIEIYFIFTILLFIPFFCTSCQQNSSSKSYPASDEALAILEEGNHEGLTIIQNKKDYIIYPEQYKAGFVFYPGGKVECEAYLPLVKVIAEKGFFTVLVRMPNDLAIFDIDAFKSYTTKYPEIEHWYIGGHSLGGAMAGSYISKHPDLVDGIVFMAAFTTKKIDNSVKTLSIYGTCDEVLNMESYEKYRGNLPENTIEVPIEGGCHSYFGDYGHQNGDGEPTISREEQLKITVDAIESNLL